MIGNKKFIRTMRLKNFLSYGEREESVHLESLNVFIGKNSSGKSNLIEALSLLNATPRDLTVPIREGGGIREWLYKGAKKSPVAGIDITFNYLNQPIPLRYRIEFTEVNQRLELVDEALECEIKTHESEEDVCFFYRFNKGRPVLNARPLSDNYDAESDLNRRTRRQLKREDLDINQSVLSQRKDPDQYPEITYLSTQFARMKFYRECNFGHLTPARLPQKSDLPEDFLMEDFGNLSLVLNDLQHQYQTKKMIIGHLQIFNQAIEDLTTRIHGGTVQLFIHETGLKHPLPATRLSDGTLRYLSLLAILCHPAPPKIVCIEEPEIGLHPDILPTIAKLLIDASYRTQLFVTTHSDVLISELTDVPESVIVCEQEIDGTSLQRLDKRNLNEWLKKYALGELWRMGEIGGV